MKKIVIFMLLSIFALMSIGCSERIDAGHAGIKVNKYGSDKGVDDVSLVTGRVWYNPITTEIYEYPTFVQNATWAQDRSISTEMKGGLAVNFSVGLNYTITDSSAPAIFKKYRKTLKEVQEGFIYKQVSDSFNNIASQYTIEYFIDNKIVVLNEIRNDVKLRLEKEGFNVETLTLLGAPQYSPMIAKSIEDKIKATQLAEQKVRELEQAKADAEKAKAVAQGQADAKVIKAEGDAKAIRVVTESLTPEYIKYSEIGKWDGKLPQVTAGTNTGFLIQR